MKKVILQPTSSKESRTNYFDTIECSVSLSRIKPFVSTKDFEILKDLMVSYYHFIYYIQLHLAT